MISGLCEAQVQRVIQKLEGINPLLGSPSLSQGRRGDSDGSCTHSPSHTG